MVMTKQKLEGGQKKLSGKVETGTQLLARNLAAFRQDEEIPNKNLNDLGVIFPCIREQQETQRAPWKIPQTEYRGIWSALE